jgi:hypothetical protein
LSGTHVEVATMMIWVVLVAVAAIVVVGLAWWSSGRTMKPAPPGADRSRRQGEVLREHGPTNVPTNPGGI